MISWPLLGFNENFSVGGDTMSRWKGSSNPQTYWRACGPTGCWPSLAVPLSGLVYFRDKKRGRVSSNTPGAWVFGWCWYSMTLFPLPVLSIAKMSSSLSLKYHICRLHWDAANCAFFVVMDLYRQACLNEKNVSLGRRQFEKAPALS